MISASLCSEAVNKSGSDGGEPLLNLYDLPGVSKCLAHVCIKSCGPGCSHRYFKLKN